MYLSPVFDDPLRIPYNPAHINWTVFEYIAYTEMLINRYEKS